MGAKCDRCGNFDEVYREEMEYSRNVNVIPLLMEIGDRVQTLNTFVPITGEIVDMYKNLVTIADDDAETVDQLLSFHADDLEVIS